MGTSGANTECDVSTNTSGCCDTISGIIEWDGWYSHYDENDTATTKFSGWYWGWPYPTAVYLAVFCDLEDPANDYFKIVAGNGNPPVCMCEYEYLSWGSQACSDAISLACSGGVLAGPEWTLDGQDLTGEGGDDCSGHEAYVQFQAA